MDQFKADCGEPKRNSRKRKGSIESVRQISIAILIVALLRALVELATAILSMLS